MPLDGSNGMTPYKKKGAGKAKKKKKKEKEKEKEDSAGDVVAAPSSFCTGSILFWSFRQVLSDSLRVTT